MDKKIANASWEPPKEEPVPYWGFDIQLTPTVRKFRIGCGCFYFLVFVVGLIIGTIIVLNW